MEKMPERFRKYFRLATTKDADCVAEHMSKESLKELGLAFNHTPQEACYKGIALSSICLTIVDPDTGEIQGIGGVTSGASIWMFLCEGAIENENMRRLLIREAKPFLNWIMYDSGKVLSFLENYADPENKAQLRWLEWLGAEITPYDMGNDVKVAMFLFRKKQKGGKKPIV